MDGGEIVRSWLDESIDKGDPLVPAELRGHNCLGVACVLDT